MSSTFRAQETRRRQERDKDVVVRMTVSILCKLAEHDPLAASSYFDPVYNGRSQVDALRNMLAPSDTDLIPRLGEAADRAVQAAAEQAERLAQEAHNRVVAQRQEQERHAAGERAELRRRARAAGRA